jgi:hypothetical protein
MKGLTGLDPVDGAIQTPGHKRPSGYANASIWQVKKQKEYTV